MLDLKEIRSQTKEALMEQVKQISKEIYNFENELKLNKKIRQAALATFKEKRSSKIDACHA